MKRILAILAIWLPLVIRAEVNDVTPTPTATQTRSAAPTATATPGATAEPSVMPTDWRWTKLGRSSVLVMCEDGVHYMYANCSMRYADDGIGKQLWCESER